MMTKNEITEIIYNCIDEINEINELNISKSTDTRLFGRESELDSLGFVNLLVSVEERINIVCDAPIVIADEKAMSQKNSPFRTIETLADYLFELITTSKLD